MSHPSMSVLYDNNKKIWGIYNSELMIKSMLSALKELNPSIEYFIEEFYVNTNISKKKILSENENTNTVKYNPCISKEIKKIEGIYEKFLSVKKTYDSFDKGRIVPEFLKKDFEFLEEMHNKHIPDSEMFHYYVDIYNKFQSI